MLKWAIVQEKLALGWAFVGLAERVDSEMHWVGRPVHLVSLFIRVIACAIFCHFPFPHEKCSAPFLSHFPLIPDPIIPLPKHPTWEANCRLWSPNRQRYALPNMLSLGKFQIVFLHYYSGYMLKWVSATPMGSRKSWIRDPLSLFLYAAPLSVPAAKEILPVFDPSRAFVRLSPPEL